LKTDHWRRKRKKIMRRDGFECTVCGSKYQLQVHHYTYERLWKERKSDLATLCSECHAKEHDDRLLDIIGMRECTT